MTYNGTRKEKQERIRQAIQYHTDFPQYEYKQICLKFYITKQSFSKAMKNMKEDQSNDLEPKEVQDEINKVENDQLNRSKINRNKEQSPEELIEKERERANFKKARQSIPCYICGNINCNCGHY